MMYVLFIKMHTKDTKPKTHKVVYTTIIMPDEPASGRRCIIMTRCASYYMT